MAIDAWASRPEFQNVCPIAELFTRFEGKYCRGNNIQSFSTLQAAKEACLTNVYCGCIDDDACNGDEWTISEDRDLMSSGAGSCAWISGKYWPFFGIRLNYSDLHIYITITKSLYIFVYTKTCNSNEQCNNTNVTQHTITNGNATTRS